MYLHNDHDVSARDEWEYDEECGDEGWGKADGSGQGGGSGWGDEARRACVSPGGISQDGDDGVRVGGGDVDGGTGKAPEQRL